MPKRIEWVACPECDGLDKDCTCCRGGGSVPIVTYTPALVADVDPWEVQE